ncbi:MAG: hypothetical protein IJ996_05565 [Clostridia bacterium]|nr:hypothetical protein [Clostridia bacterium]
MKFEKRDITLNEADSIRDMLQTEKNTLIEYAVGLSAPLAKQTQNAWLKNLGETAQSVGELQAVLQGLIEEREE